MGLFIKISRAKTWGTLESARNPKCCIACSKKCVVCPFDRKFFLCSEFKVRWLVVVQVEQTCRSSTETVSFLVAQIGEIGASGDCFLERRRSVVARSTSSDVTVESTTAETSRLHVKTWPFHGSRKIVTRGGHFESSGLQKFLEKRPLVTPFVRVLRPFRWWCVWLQDGRRPDFWRSPVSAQTPVDPIVAGHAHREHGQLQLSNTCSWRKWHRRDV